MARTLQAAKLNSTNSEVLAAIDSSNKCAEIQAANYKFQAKLSELERQFQLKASELRADFLHECEEIQAS
jgi:hypothetical protein